MDAWEEQQEYQRKKRLALEQEASECSTAQLLQAASWYETLSEHGDEIGEASPSNNKLSVVRAELRRRGY